MLSVSLAGKQNLECHENIYHQKISVDTDEEVNGIFTDSPKTAIK